MSKGIARQLERLGRVVIPAEMRRELGWATGDLIEISSVGGAVVLRKRESCCALCGKDLSESSGYASIRGKPVCNECIEIARLVADSKE